MSVRGRPPRRGPVVDPASDVTPGPEWYRELAELNGVPPVPLVEVAAVTKRWSESQHLAAEWFRGTGWPYAEAVGSGRPGADVTGMPGRAPEVWSPHGQHKTVQAKLKQAAHSRWPARIPTRCSAWSVRAPGTSGPWPSATA